MLGVAREHPGRSAVRRRDVHSVTQQLDAVLRAQSAREALGTPIFAEHAYAHGHSLRAPDSASRAIFVASYAVSPDAASGSTGEMRV